MQHYIRCINDPFVVPNWMDYNGKFYTFKSHMILESRGMHVSIYIHGHRKQATIATERDGEGEEWNISTFIFCFY